MALCESFLSITWNGKFNPIHYICLLYTGEYIEQDLFITFIITEIMVQTLHVYDYNEKK